MHECEAMESAKVAGDDLNRRLGRRLTVLVSVVGLILLSGSAQAAKAQPVLEKVSPEAGCPGTHITLTGKNFPTTGKLTVAFTAPVFPFFTPEPAMVMSRTSATSVVPIFLT